MTIRKVFDRLYDQAAEQRERRRVEREKRLAEQARDEEETMLPLNRKAGKMERKQSDDLFERLYNGYAARRRFVDEQREAQAKEFIEMAQPGGLGRGPDIDRINSLYEDYKGRRQARLEAFIARQKEIDEMARGYREREELSERRRLLVEAAEEKERRKKYKTIVKLPRGGRLPTPRCARMLNCHGFNIPIDPNREEKPRGLDPIRDAEVQARVDSLYKDAIDRRERQRDREERKQLLDLAADIGDACGGMNAKALPSTQEGDAVHDRLHRSRFAPPCRVSKVLAKDECWEKFNTKTCSVHASRQLTPDALKETFDRL
ncbi:hypothetical protein Pmar_PMAR013115 [Perkinsus marinus ATCC 50983]|uniref:Uncharacterized protein n=1 Tax=Perkinsus marinus (strain ATCC 50983 / TXsc) TaxID=423536 RepID=C5L4Y4_PERM5|nr:hypothetical protein Pmar_PMAR013115 [Perkinsus marinus ATCC 50983]EER08204.1 hypothetical protein Pmar_PMAR013115 [Perkinsus marinus ATCC 50983]|eukprot:XP_002776388.1 hypothetical protein Pmar_PMAR013115 [Perkinsus marinus ATCC 50983]